jgi:hypothetical protein
MQMYIFNLRFLDLSPGLGLPPLISLILFYVSQHRSLTAIGQKKASSHSLVSLEIHVVGAERRAQVSRPTCLIFEQ